MARFWSELEAIAAEALFHRFAEVRLAGVTPLGDLVVLVPLVCLLLLGLAGYWVFTAWAGDEVCGPVLAMAWGRLRDLTPRTRASLRWAAGVGVLVAAALCWAAYHFVPLPKPQAILTFDRRMTFANGVSPLVPAFFLCAVLPAWGFFYLKKFALIARFTVAPPLPQKRLRRVCRPARPA
jgi:hypothetical protein